MPCGNTLSQIMTSVIMSDVGLLRTVSETVSGLNSSQADNTMQHSQIIVLSHEWLVTAQIAVSQPIQIAQVV